MNATLPMLAALYAGLAGSMHCVGMCGGIAALGGVGASRPAIHVTLFNLGRVASYAVAGALGGALLGAGLALTPSPGTRMTVALLTAVVLGAIGLYYLVNLRLFSWIEVLGGRLWKRLAPLTGRLLPVRHPLQALALGALWGWLPCGLVYMMLPLAWATGSATGGALVMGIFGLGTAPAMIGIGLGGGGLRSALRSPKYRRWAGATMIVFGVLMGAGPWLFPHGASHDHGGAGQPLASSDPSMCTQEKAHAP